MMHFAFTYIHVSRPIWPAGRNVSLRITTNFTNDYRYLVYFLFSIFRGCEFGILVRWCFPWMVHKYAALSMIWGRLLYVFGDKRLDVRNRYKVQHSSGTTNLCYKTHSLTQFGTFNRDLSFFLCFLEQLDITNLNYSMSRKIGLYFTLHWTTLIIYWFTQSLCHFFRQFGHFLTCRVHCNQ